MPLTDEEEKKIWEEWLDDKYGEKLDAIKKEVKEIYKKNIKTYGDLPFYTPHGPAHYQAVEDLIHKLISGYNYKKLALKERFYLLASAWLHDLGMLPYVCSIVYKTEFPFSETEIRKRHHITSEKFIVGNWFDLKIDESDKEILGKLSRYHRKIEKFDINDDSFLVGNESFRLTLLASYLRLADSLDIGSSRTPSEPYSICLAYDIPNDSKLHWIKSKLINGVNINHEEHSISIQFKCPNKKDMVGVIDLNTAHEKIDSIINLVTEDLRDELSSVINIITRAGFSYYLDIKVKKTCVGLDNQMLNDLRELVINYDIMMAPSASRLLDIILSTTANILGFSLVKGNKPVPFFIIPKNDIETTSNNVSNFLISIEKNILQSRPCHLGLINLIENCKKYTNKLKDKKSINNAIQEINAIYQNHHNSRGKIRDNAKDCFRFVTNKEQTEANYNILLFGYSELATKAICGLRDLLLEKTYNISEPKMIYGSPLEQSISDKIRIFICEGQPKTQTNYNDRLIYHDGSQYAFYLSQRGFKNLVIIPDILAGTIMRSLEVNFVILGANGVTKEYFTHSAGHSAIVDLAQTEKAFSKKNLYILLVSNKEKFFSNGDLKIAENSKDGIIEIEGCLFSTFKNLPSNRTHSWMTRDTKLIEKIYDSNISFLNPREDKVAIDKVDYIISDSGYKAIDKKYYKESIVDLFCSQEDKNAQQ